MALTNAEKQARFRARRSAELEELRNREIVSDPLPLLDAESRRALGEALAAGAYHLRLEAMSGRRGGVLAHHRADLLDQLRLSLALG
jgi:hypothetical protein